MKVVEQLAARIAGAVTNTRGPRGGRRWIEKGEDGQDWLVLEGYEITPGEPPALFYLPCKEPLSGRDPDPEYPNSLPGRDPDPE